MSDTTTVEAPIAYSQLPVGSKSFRVYTKEVKPRKTKSGEMTKGKKFVVFSPASLEEAKDLFSVLLDEAAKHNKDKDAIAKFVSDLLDDRCEDATNATLVKQPDGSFAKKPENYIPELVNISRASRAGGEKIKDLRERRAELSEALLDLKDFREKNNTDALIAANSPKDENGKPRYTSLAQINTIMAQWTMERKALVAKIAEHDAKAAAAAEKREKKAAEKAAENAVPAKA